MNYFKGQERICQRDAPGDPSTRCSVEIPDIFSDVQPSRDRPRPHITCEDGLIRPRLDGSLRNDEFATHRFCCPLVADTSPSYSSVPCPDRMPPQSSPSHFWNPLLGLGKNEPCVWTAEGAVPYGMLSEEISDAVASISTEVADECSQQAYSRQEFDGDLAQYNQLDLGQNEQPRQKIPVYASNVCQVVCSVNGEGQMLMLNHCSPKQLVHPEALGCGAPSLQPSWCPADPKGSPQHCLTQGRGDGVPVSLCPVQTGLSSQPYPSSLTCSAFVQPSSVLSPASGYMFNLMPAPYTSQFHQAPCPEHPDTVGRTLEGQTSRSSHVSWERLKKPCNCTKSQCLKLYCDCFANGEVCSNCNCINCCNNMEHESERCRAIKICLDRNPEAFHPKIDIRKRGCLKGRHTKGCNCKRSGCLKNYCECYEAKIMCSSSCKCVGCRNYEGSPVMERAGRDNPSSTYNLYSDSRNTKSPLSCITPDVVEATCGCLLAQAEEAEKDGQASPQAERLILEEFGQCLAQIVQSIFKYTRVKW